MGPISRTRLDYMNILPLVPSPRLRSWRGKATSPWLACVWRATLEEHYRPSWACREYTAWKTWLREETGSCPTSTRLHTSSSLASCCIFRRFQPASTASSARYGLAVWRCGSVVRRVNEVASPKFQDWQNIFLRWYPVRLVGGGAARQGGDQ